MKLEVGAIITWLYVSRNGYSYPQRVPARVIKINKKTIRIAALRADLKSFKEVSIKSENIRESTEKEIQMIKDAINELA